MSWRTKWNGHTDEGRSQYVLSRVIDPLATQRAHVDAYARTMAEVDGRSPATVARHLSTLSGFYRYAVVIRIARVRRENQAVSRSPAR